MSESKHEAFLTLVKGIYYSRIWFFSSEKADFDVLVAVMRELPRGAWTLKYRFRYYEDDKAHDSADRKSHWTATLGGEMSEAEVLGRVAPVLVRLAEMTGLDRHTIVVESDEPALISHLMMQSPHFSARYQARKVPG